MSTYLFVGLRNGALEAAREGGFRAVALDERRPAKGRRAMLSAWRQVPFDADPTVLVREARELLSGGTPVAVVALTEQAVVPAAHIRTALGVPGNDIETAWRCHDKRRMKEAARAAGIPVAPHVLVGEKTTADSLIRRLGLPLVLKPPRDSGARGTVVAHHRRQVRAGLRPGWLAEGFVYGVEMSMEAFLADGKVLFRNPTDYVVPFWANIVPADHPPSVLSQVGDLLERTVRALGVERGIVHMELFLTPDGPVLGELALRPPGGHIMELIHLAYGFDPWRALLEVERGRPLELPQHAVQPAGAWILHPGEGVVGSVRGLAAARRTAGVVDVRCRVRRGDTVEPRRGSGNEVGRILATGATQAAVASSLKTARERLVISVRSVHSSTASSSGSSAPSISARVSS